LRYFIELSYNGKNYHGWQIQPDVISIQEKLNFTVSTVLQEKIEVVGAGRTGYWCPRISNVCSFRYKK
jgi:tRNA pseudouridine38-40 synthase